MRGFIKMIKQSKHFYLVTFAILLFFILIESFFLCEHKNTSTNKNAFLYSIEENSKIKFIEENKEYFVDGMDYSDVFKDKINNISSFSPLLILVLSIVLIKEFVYIDKSAKEFREFLPIKKKDIGLFNFVGPILMMLLIIILQGIFFICYQTGYNLRMLKIAQGFGLDECSNDIVKKSNINVISTMMIYVLLMILAYEFLYLGSIVTKNAFLGIAIFYISFQSLVEISRFTFYLLEPYKISKNIYESIINRLDIFQKFIILNYDYFQDIAMENLILILIILIVLIFLFIIAAVNKREVTKGKIFYFSIVDYVFSIFSGMLIVLIFQDIFGITTYLTSIIFVFGVMVVFFLIHPRKRTKKKMWEV